MQTNISTYIQANIIIIYLFFLGVFLITATFAFLVENDQCGDHLQRNSGMCANKERGWGERDDDTLSNTLVILVLLLQGEPIVMGHRMS